MRTLITLIFGAISCGAVNAQDVSPHFGGAGAFTGGIAFIDHAAFPMLGGRGGVLIDHQFLIGGGGASGWGSTPGRQGGNASLDLGYGGLLLGWWPLDGATVRPTFDVLIGGGGYQREEAVEGDLYRIDRGGGFAVSGEVGVSIRLHEHIRFSMAAGWRSILMDDPLLDGATMVAGIWFGEF